VLFGGWLRLDGDDRDRFTLAKGHAALALYAALEATGRLPQGSVETYCADDTLLGVHPDVALEGIDFSTGSLGQGLSMATGAALAAKLQGSGRRSVVVISDAELNEGSVWEAVTFAAHHRLDNLVVLVDHNGQQALGYTEDVLDLGDVEAKLRGFGWRAEVVDGHDHDALAAALTRSQDSAGQPHVLVAETTFGQGVDFMASRVEWHYLPLTAEQYEDAMRQLEAARA
jgi:transketolase